MKLSVSLSESDVSYLDAYAQANALDSRSAALQRAVRALRTFDLASDYAEAWAEWDTTEEADGWDATIADGLDASR